MTQTVALPLWLLILIILFAAVTASTHLLFPSVRWYFRRRAERIVARLNERLQHPIQPFKLLRRQDMIQRVIYDPEVMRAAAEYAAETGVREDVAFEKARDFAREIVPSFSASAYFGFAIRFARWLATWLFDVRLTYTDEAALSAVDPKATVVFVINHRSNFDYVLVTYLAADRSALSYAVGEWARVWPLSALIKALGAYFIRRRQRGALYRQVLSTYVQKATGAGVAQAVFPEGGLSRDGRLGPPKLGILAYIVEGWRKGDRDVVFVPVALNYDRVVEDRILIAAGRAGSRQFRASAPEAVGFVLRYFRRRLTGRVGRFGTAAVTFGHPLSLAEFAGGEEADLVPALAGRLFDDIAEAMPLTTAPLALAALTALGGARPVGEIAAWMDAHYDDPPAGGDTGALEAVLDGLVLRRVLTVQDGLYRIVNSDLAKFYVNSLELHFSAPASEGSAQEVVEAESEKS